MNLIDNIKEIINNNNLEHTREYYQTMNGIYKNNNKEKYIVKYPILNDKDLTEIKDNLLEGNYPNKLKPLITKLYAYTELNNLLNCSNNLKSIKLIKDKEYKCKIFGFSERYISGKYDAGENAIYYYDDTTLPHELMHMSSTPLNENTDNFYVSGFKIYHDKVEFSRGLNEGYTDLMAHRIFFDENYNSDSCYKINTYLLRIFELLYDNYKTMEKDYFNANYQSPIGHFVKYGSLDEYFKLTTYMDWFAFTKVINNEDEEIFNLLNTVIKRINNQKYLNAEEITEEYFESEQKPYKKIFTKIKR